MGQHRRVARQGISAWLSRFSLSAMVTTLLLVFPRSESRSWVSLRGCANSSKKLLKAPAHQHADEGCAEDRNATISAFRAVEVSMLVYLSACHICLVVTVIRGDCYA